MTPDTIESAEGAGEPWLQAHGSRYFLDWLADVHVGLAFSTYQTGKVFFVGQSTDGGLSLFERSFNRCMGLWSSPDGQTIWLGSKFQLWRFERAEITSIGDLSHGAHAWAERGHDVVYVPRMGYTTGDLDLHDIAMATDGRIIFVATLFNSLATISERASFQPLWRPPFVNSLVAEDRCHLNGLAMRDGRAAFATAVAACDVVDGWRDRRHDGGCVIDVASGEIACRGLSMPHSPRWYRGRLWIVNSGTGEFGSIDLAAGRFEPLTFCPGYLRGLTFVGDYAVVTLSKPRHASFLGLALDEGLLRRGAEAQCALYVIDLRSGAVAHWLRIDSPLVTELYDVVALTGVRQPMALGFKTSEIERLFVVDEPGEL